MTEEDERERHINMHLSPETMAGAYANFAEHQPLRLRVHDHLRRLDHEVDEEEIPAWWSRAISPSPKFMRELIDAMEDNYSKWRTREGIKNLPEYAAASTPSRDDARTARPHSPVRAETRVRGPAQGSGCG